jgi:hypothetical protein
VYLLIAFAETSSTSLSPLRASLVMFRFFLPDGPCSAPFCYPASYGNLIRSVDSYFASDDLAVLLTALCKYSVKLFICRFAYKYIYRSELYRSSILCGLKSFSCRPVISYIRSVISLVSFSFSMSLSIISIKFGWKSSRVLPRKRDLLVARSSIVAWKSAVFSYSAVSVYPIYSGCKLSSC